MKKTFVSLFAVIFSLMVASLAHAEAPLSQRLSGKINQAVKSAQQRAVPSALITAANLKWWEHGTVLHQSPRYKEEGTFQMHASCRAILYNYKMENSTMVVSVALDKRCFKDFDDSPAPFFVFTLDLGKYGSYSSGELAGEPFAFEMEIEKDSQKKQQVFQYKNTKAGAVYVMNMPVRTEALQKSIKNAFAKSGTVSLEKAAQYLQNVKKPTLSSSFMAD